MERVSLTCGMLEHPVHKEAYLMYAGVNPDWKTVLLV